MGLTATDRSANDTTSATAIDGSSRGHTKGRTGRGNVKLSLYNDTPCLEALAFSYPLKLVAPTAKRAAGVPRDPATTPPRHDSEPAQTDDEQTRSSDARRQMHQSYVGRVQVVYVLSYGGGLVGGDAIHLSCDVDSGAVLALSTQGSTKVFKRRSSLKTAQSLTVRVASDAVCLLVPDPVQPFAESAYAQRQEFDLADTSASLLLLDWVTSGRPDNGERWTLSSYLSENVVRRAGRLLLRDCQCMRSPSAAAQMGRYDCIAAVLLAGDVFDGDSDVLLRRFADEERVRPSSKRTEHLIWTAVRHRDVTVLKVAGLSSEEVRAWLHDLAEAMSWRARFGRDPFRAVER